MRSADQNSLVVELGLSHLVAVVGSDPLLANRVNLAVISMNDNAIRMLFQNSFNDGGVEGDDGRVELIAVWQKRKDESAAEGTR